MGLLCETAMKNVNNIYVAKFFFPNAAQCYNQLIIELRMGW